MQVLTLFRASVCSVSLFLDPIPGTRHPGSRGVAPGAETRGHATATLPNVTAAGSEAIGVEVVAVAVAVVEPPGTRLYYSILLTV